MTIVQCSDEPTEATNSKTKQGPVRHKAKQEQTAFPIFLFLNPPDDKEQREGIF